MITHSMKSSFNSTGTIRFLASLLVAAGSAGCQITKSLTLSPPTGITATSALKVHTLKVTAPPVGTNVFVFEDVANWFVTGGQLIGAPGIVRVNDYKRADFNYILANDSGPMFGTVLKNLFQEDPACTVDAQIAADFKYGLMERKDWAGIAGWENMNKVGIRMVARLTLASNGKVVLAKNYTALAEDSYSTRWLTFPSSDFLDGLFQKALKGISSQIAGDTEVTKHL